MIVAMQLVERPRGVASYGAVSVKAMPDLVRARFRVVRLDLKSSWNNYGSERYRVRRGNHRLLNHPRLTPTGYCWASSWVRATPVAQP